MICGIIVEDSTARKVLTIVMKFQSLDMLLRFGKEFGHKQLRTHGFNDTEFLICSFVLRNPGCTQLDVSKGLKLDKTTLTKSLTMLEGKGCISRVQDIHDRRKNRLTITPDGEERLTEILGLHDQWMEKVLDVLTEEEQQQMDNYVKRLLDAAEALKKD